MSLIECYYPERGEIPMQNFSPMHVMGMCISIEDISNFCKSKLSQEDKEQWENCTFYPIKIKQNEDLSFDVILGVMI